MKINLRYGREVLLFDLPEDLDIQLLRLNPLPPLNDSRQSIEASFGAPIGAPPLDRLARGRESACIVICDFTRPVPNQLILEPMLACLHDCGIPAARVTIVVATGLHRPNEGPELAEMIGEKVANKYRVVNHVARDRSGQTSLGDVPLGVNGASAPVAINSAYLRGDLKITTGLIEPHLMAGYSGGRKLVCPGIAAADTIMQFHSPRMIADARAHAGNIQDNPVHAMSRAVAGMAGVDFICNVTLSEDRRLTGVFCGDLDAAHAAGVAHVDRQTKVPCSLSDIVITSAAGYPLDTTLYQAIKGMVGAAPAIKPGGTMIVAASMSQGVGGPEFTELCRGLRSVDEFLDRIHGAAVRIDQWQLQEMMQVLQRCEVMVVTDGIEPDFLRRCLLTPMPSVDDAVRAALAKHGTNAKVSVIPEGPYLTPVPH